MRSRSVGARWATVITLAASLHLAAALPAHAALIKFSLINPTYTPTCPPRIGTLTGYGFTGVEGTILSLVIGTVGVQGTFNTPTNEYIAPMVFETVDNVAIALPENNVTPGSYLMTSTHEWISIAQVPQFDYTNAFLYLPTN